MRNECLLLKSKKKRQSEYVIMFFNCNNGCTNAPQSYVIRTRCVQVLRSPNLFKKNYSPQEAENAVISQRSHPVDVHIFHNAHATIAWPQQTLL